MKGTLRFSVIVGLIYRGHTKRDLVSGARLRGLDCHVAEEKHLLWSKYDLTVYGEKAALDEYSAAVDNYLQQGALDERL